MTKISSNLKEVARQCCVSQSTVSRILNNTKHGRFSVSTAVRDRVLKVAQELNYRPSMAARNLTISKTNLIAVLGLSRIESDHVGPEEEAISAMTKMLDSHGYDIWMQFPSHRHGAFELPSLRFDGVVAVGPTSLNDLQALESSDLPYVSLDGLVGPRGMQVIPDDAQGTRMAVEHLKSLGHHRIAYFGNPSATALHPGVFARQESFVAALREFGMESPDLDPPRLMGDVSWDSTYEPFLKRAVVQGGATAVLAYSHFVALSLLRTGRDLGLNVPDDFSLVCFNNIPVLKLTTPSLTAIDLPSMAMGQAAAELLLQSINQSASAPSRTQKLAETLVVRESSSRPRCLV